jgi:hypothetical protein
MVKTMTILKVLIRLLCAILFVATIFLIPLQLIYVAVIWCITGRSGIGNPLPFQILDTIDDWFYEHGVDLTTNS